MSETRLHCSSGSEAVAAPSAAPDAPALAAGAPRPKILARHAGDLRKAARRRLPRAIFDYLDGGSYDEITLEANRTDLDALRLRPRTIHGVTSRSRRTVLLGQDSVAPFALGPTGFAGLIYPDGEVHAARAAEAFGVPFCLSTFSIRSIEDVAAAVGNPFLFQLYMFKDRAINEGLIQRAADAGCSGLVLTIDTAVQGRRNRDLDNGVSIPLRYGAAVILQFLTRPRWLYGWLQSRRVMGNLATFLPADYDLGDMSAWAERHHKGAMSRADIEWVRRVWPGKLAIKGVLDPEDAKIAVELGADAVIVSNHGGRQLDSAITAVRAFPEIREAVGDRIELLFDGGVRSGIDVLKALGLGAKGCFLGRAFLYGLAAHGGPGVQAALQLMYDELDAGMALVGVENVEQMPSRLLWRAAEAPRA